MAVYKIPVTKGGPDAFVEINTDPDSMPEEVYAYALQLGLKQLVNRGMTKVAKGKHAEAMEVAKTNAEKIKSGKIRMVGVKRAAGQGRLMTEALRIARGLVKASIRADGDKIGNYTAAQITAAAKVAVEEDPGILTEAKENLEALDAKLKSGKRVSLAALKTPSAGKKGMVDADQLSAAQAGKPARHVAR